MKLELEEAVAQIRAAVRPLPSEEVPAEAALGRVLAEDVRAAVTQPPFDRSALDGYALRAADTGETPRRLPVLETVYAGGWPTYPLEPGQATRIMTGAPVPAGCDCVLRQEDTDYGTEAVELHTRLRPGDNICRTGEDFFAGELLLSRGMRLNAVALGVLAAAGIDRVRVRRRPRCAVMCTGDELAPAGMRPLPRGKIYSANDALLRARLAQWGMELLPGPACWADDPDALARAMAEIRADAIFTTGGVSVGARDILHQALPLLGAERLFWRVALKPGSPLMFSMYHQTPILSLSGNPFAAMTTLELFGRPLLSGLLDTDSLLLRPFPAVLDTPFPKGGIRRFVRGFFQGGHVTLAATNASGQLRSAAEANCLVELRMPAEAGTTVPVYLL